MKIKNYGLKTLLLGCFAFISFSASNPGSEDLPNKKNNNILLGINVATSGFSLQTTCIPYEKSKLISWCAIDEKVYTYPDDTTMDPRTGDCFPTTWANDDNLYTFFDDGPGFASSKSGDWSMHPAKIIGTPTSAVGINISTNQVGKSNGGGKRGTKVCGLIAVPDPNNSSKTMLVAWVRNANINGGAYLIYSTDNASNWNYPNGKGPEIIPDLGHPAWMQAGKQNGSAKDEYLYFYSQNKPTAYLIADNVIMGRVLAKNVLDMSKYEYFNGTTTSPSWTNKIANRTPVFTATGQCYRVYVTYNPGLNRYFLSTSTGGAEYDGETKVVGKLHNLGIYESENPWGPWYTVYWNDYYSPYGTFCPQVLPKWMSPDGKSFWLLYSCWPNGPYKFNLQKVTLTVASRSK